MHNIDLHTHSTFSDGTYTPTELVNYAKEKGLSALALTDHDTVDGLDEARQQSESVGIHFINGIEINSFCCCNDRKIKIHILGYLFTPSIIKPYMEQLKILRQQHNQAIIKALNAIGITINDSDLGKNPAKSVITRLDFAKALVQKGYVDTVDDALREYLHKGGLAYVEGSRQPVELVFQKIHEAGGIVSLAHLAEYGLNECEEEDLVSSLTQIGLDAIECIHPSQDSAYSQKIRNLAWQNGLALTGGSDFHGESKDGMDLGVGGEGMLIPESFLQNLM